MCRAAWLLSVLLIAPVAIGAPPRNLARDITSADSLSATQQRQVKDYVGYYANELANSDSPEGVQVAREKLGEPLKVTSVPSVAFRFDYGRIVIDELEDGGVLGSEAHRAVNAVLVISRLSTESALEALLDHADIDQQAASYVRGRAVLGCRHILVAAQTNPQLAIPPRDVKSALRRLRDAAKDETDVIILRHQLETLLAIDLPEARARLVEALSSVIDRIEEAPDDPPSPLIEPATFAVGQLRNIFIDLNDEDEQVSIGTKIGPCLGQLLETIEEHWQAAQDQAPAKQTYGAAIEACEDFLKRIHATVGNGRGVPTARLKEAWDEDKKPTYVEGVELWIEQLSQDPYK